MDHEENTARTFDSYLGHITEICYCSSQNEGVTLKMDYLAS